MRQGERYYIQKIDYLQTISSAKGIIWKNEDRLHLLIYEEESWANLEFVENFEYNNDNNLDQIDTEYYFIDKE